MKRFEVLSSPSELRLRIYGDSLEDLFRHALQGIFENAEPEFVSDSLDVSHRLSLKATDQEVLLVDFLSEALTLSDIHNEAYSEVEFEILADRHLEAQIFGKRVKRFNLELKAVTHHEVHISKKDGALTTDLMIDI